MLEIAGYSGLEPLHRGPRSLVIRGKRKADGLPVVIKTPAADYPSADDLSRLRHEFELGRSAEAGPAKAHVVRHVELIAVGSSMALVLEDFGANSLRTQPNGRSLSLEAFLELALSISAAVHAVHRAGMLHLDINPSNVLFNPKRRELRLSDLSAGMRLERVGLPHPRFRGTLAYASPEQTQRTGRTMDFRADLYSLGVTLFELLTGHLPFHGRDALETFHRHLTTAPPSACDVRSDVPAALASVLLRLLRKDPDDRYRSASGVHADLLRCLQQLSKTGSIVPFELGSDDRTAHFAIPQKLYGRQREFAQLTAEFERSQQGRSTLLLVSGEPGVGKSALLERLREHVQVAGGQFYSGKFDPRQTNAPYAAFASALRAFVHSILTRPSADVFRWRERLVGALGPNGQLLVRYVPELERVIGPQPDVPELEPEQAQARFHHLVLNLLEKMALPEAPLVIFLDDLQWSDQASIALIAQLMKADRLAHLMLVVAYRDGEVHGGHPIAVLREKLANACVPVEIALSPLQPADVERMLGDCLQSTVEQCLPLAGVVWRKTRGNPFFVAQFLRTLHSAGLLWFDSTTARWVWDIAACDAQGMTDNVVDLVLERIHGLGRRSQEALRYAACIGSEFALETLMATLNMESAELQDALSEAVSAELLTPTLVKTGPAELEIASGRYRFVHDQMQQAAYLLTPERQRPQLHLAIGRALFAEYTGERQREHSFQILDQLLAGSGLVTHPAERLQIAELCLTAGRRAKSANAYDAATHYLRSGMELLGPDAWSVAYDASLALHQEYAESAYLAGNSAEMAHSCGEVIAHGRTFLEQAPAHQLELTAHIARNEVPRALAVARQVLQKLGVRLPSRVNDGKLALHVARTAWKMRNETPQSLLARPPMRDARLRCAMQILAQAASPAYLSSPKLFPLVICEMLELTLEHGVSEWSADALIGWGVIQIAAFGATERGYAVATCAPRLIELLGAAPRRARTQTNYNLLIRHWIEPLRSTLEPLGAASRDALDHGDLLYASVAGVTRAFYMFAAGCPLAEVEDTAVALAQMILPLGQDRYRRDVGRILQLVRCLQGRAPEPKRLRGEFFDDEEALRASVAEGDRAAMASLNCERALLLYMYTDLPAALECCAEAARHVDSVLGTVYPPMLDFLSALVRARLLTGNQPLAARRSELGRIRASLRRLEKWAGAAAVNHQHRVHLVRAELARLDGDSAGAAREYELAIELARRHGYLHELAMSLECAGRFYVASGQERVAVATLLAARDAWTSWGALAKGTQLENEFSLLLAPQQAQARPLPAVGDSTFGHRTFEFMDIASVIKASQAIVSEIRLPGLIRRLLKLCMENTGAHRGLLFLNDGGRLRLEAAQDVDDRESSSKLQAFRVSSGAEPLLPMSIVEYVARVREPLLEVNVSAASLFARDPYVIEERPLSVLCVPMISQGVLAGVVYLENNRMRGAFSAERLHVLHLLSALSAISLENARLYEDAERAHALQVRLSEAQARFVPVEFLRSLNRESIVDVDVGDNIRKEMTVLFSDVRDFTRLVESMPSQDHIGFINGYLAHMEPAIVEAGGFVDSYMGDGIMALFEADPDNALRAAIKMSTALVKFNDERQAMGQSSVGMGVGISTGALTLGTIGGPGRIKCGVIGDTVNLASRIESLTKYFACFLLISQHTRERLRAPEHFHLRMVDRVRVKGKLQPITLFEVLDAEPAYRAQAKQRTAHLFDEALALYVAGQFRDAKRLFAECLALCPSDGAALRLNARCRQYEIERPADWDGVNTATEK